MAQRYYCRVAGGARLTSYSVMPRCVMARDRLIPNSSSVAHRIRRAGAVALSLILFCAACFGEREPQARERTESAVAAPYTSQDSGSRALTSSGGSINEPAVIYVEATNAEIDAAREGVPEEDFAVIGDDLMFYRSSALENLTAWHIPFTQLAGRRPIEFTIDGVPQTVDFSDTALLDFIVVYRPNQRPRVFAPNDIDQVRSYWESGSAQRD